MTTIHFATLKNTFDKHPVEREMSLGSFIEFLKDTTKRLSVDPNWTKEEYDEAKKKQCAIAPVGGRRKDEVAIDSVIKLDFDHRTPAEYRSIRRKFLRAKFCNIVHTTASHDHACKGGDSAFRVLIPTSVPFDPNDAWMIQREIMVELGIDESLRDHCTEDGNRLVYLPHRESDIKDNEGECIDPNEYIARATARGLKKREARAIAADEKGINHEIAYYCEAELGLEPLSSGRGYEVPCPNEHLHTGNGSTAIMLDGKEVRFVCQHTNNGACSQLNKRQHLALRLCGLPDELNVTRQPISLNSIRDALPGLSEEEIREQHDIENESTSVSLDDLEDECVKIEPALPIGAPIIENVIHSGEHMALVAAPNAGKTMVIAYLAYSVMTGIPFLGKAPKHAADTTAHRIKKGRVVYLSGEGTGQVKRDLMANQMLHGIAYDENDFSYLESRDFPDLTTNKESKSRFFAECDGARMVFVDTFAAVFACEDENAVAKTTPIMNFMQELALTAGCAVVFTQHTDKEGKNYRGSSSIGGSVASMVTLEVPDVSKPWEVNLRVDKMRAQGWAKGSCMGITSESIEVVTKEEQAVKLIEANGYFGEQTCSKAIPVGNDDWEIRFNSPFNGYAINLGWQAPFQEVSNRQITDGVVKDNLNSARLETLKSKAYWESKKDFYDATGLTDKTWPAFVTYAGEHLEFIDAVSVGLPKTNKPFRYRQTASVE